MWTIQGEWNQCTFEGRNTLLDVRRFFFCSLYDQMDMISGHSFSSLIEFLNLCTFCCSCPQYTTCVHEGLLVFQFFSMKFHYLSKNYYYFLVFLITIPIFFFLDRFNYSKFFNNNDVTENHIMPQCSPKGISLPEISSYFLE